MARELPGATRVNGHPTNTLRPQVVTPKEENGFSDNIYLPEYGEWRRELPRSGCTVEEEAGSRSDAEEAAGHRRRLPLPHRPRGLWMDGGGGKKG